MQPLRVLGVTARTASLLIAPEGVRYHLPGPIAWALEDDAGKVVASGQTDTASVFLDGLEPDRAYRFVTDTGDLDIRTAACGGLIDARVFGASPESEDNTVALQAAIDAVPFGGTLRIPAGRYLTLPIHLKSRMTLLLDEGAELAAVSSRAAWPKVPALDNEGRVIGTWEGQAASCYTSLVTALDCEDVSITGRGTIDGGGDRGDWWQWPKETRDGARRPRTLHLAYCERVAVTGLTIRNSPSWTVHTYRCRDLHFSGLRIENPADSPNTDGLNPESSEDVGIVAVDFSVGDDCIAIKAGKAGAGRAEDLAPTRRISITHCRMRFGHGAVVLGSEMSGGISDVTIRACEFHQTDRGLRVKTRRGRGGAVENVAMSDVTMVDVPTPLAINAFYFCDPDGKSDWVQSRDLRPADHSTPVIRNIRLDGVTAHGVSLAAAAVLGLPESPVADVRLEDFRVSYDPEAQPGIPLMACGVRPVRHAGIIAENASVTGTVEVIQDRGQAA